MTAIRYALCDVPCCCYECLRIVWGSERRDGRIIPPTNCKLKYCTAMRVKSPFSTFPPFKFILPVCWAWENNKTNNREHDVDNTNVEWCPFQLLWVAAHVRARAPSADGRVDETQRPICKWEQLIFFFKKIGPTKKTQFFFRKLKTSATAGQQCEKYWKIAFRDETPTTGPNTTEIGINQI